MFEMLVGLFFAVVATSILVRFFRKRRGKKDGARVRGPVDTWVEEALAGELGKRIRSERATVLKALQGEPEPETVGAIESAVKSVQLAFERMADATGGDEAEVRVEVAFEDGSTASCKKRMAFGDLPQDVRDELSRTGGARTYRPWSFPWASA